MKNLDSLSNKELSTSQEMKEIKSDIVDQKIDSLSVEQNTEGYNSMKMSLEENISDLKISLGIKTYIKIYDHPTLKNTCIIDSDGTLTSLYVNPATGKYSLLLKDGTPTFDFSSEESFNCLKTLNLINYLIQFYSNYPFTGGGIHGDDNTFGFGSGHGYDTINRNNLVFLPGSRVVTSVLKPGTLTKKYGYIFNDPSLGEAFASYLNDRRK